MTGGATRCWRAFCAEVLAQATDDTIDVFDKALGAADRAAQRKHEDRRRSQGRDTQDTIKRFIELGRLLLQARSEASIRGG